MSASQDSAGVAFMITGAMRAALRDRGLSDEDIQNLAPEDAHRLLLTPDPQTVKRFFEVLTTLATASLGGHAPPGFLQLCRVHPNHKALVPSRYQLGNVDGMVKTALADSEVGANAYVEARFVNSGLRGKKRGELSDTIAVFALVIDSDADKSMAWTPPPSIFPTLVVETSPGNHQYWYFLREAVSAARAQSLGERIRRTTGCDSDTGNPCAREAHLDGSSRFGAASAST